MYRDLHIVVPPCLEGVHAYLHCLFVIQSATVLAPCLLMCARHSSRTTTAPCLFVSHHQPFKVKQMYLLILEALYLGIGERLGQVSYVP